MIITKIKNGQKIVRTTSEEFEKSKVLPNRVEKKKRVLTPIKKPVVKTPVKKTRKKRGCGCGK